MAFTGRSRRRTTKWTVLLWDKVARLAIAAGGIGTIMAVAAVFLFLLSVVVPLFLPASVNSSGTLPAPWAKRTPVHFGADEYLTTGWTLFDDGRLVAFRLDEGKILADQPLVSDGRPTAAFVNTDGEHFALGFADGTVRLGRVQFNRRTAPIVVNDDDNETSRAALARLEEEARQEGKLDALLNLKDDESIDLKGEIVTRVKTQYRRLKLAAELQSAVSSGSNMAIRAIGYTTTSSGPIFGTVAADGATSFNLIEEKLDLLTGDKKLSASGGQAPAAKGTSDVPEHLLISDLGDIAYVIWRNGHCARYNIRNLDKIELAEELQLTPGGAEVTAAKLLAGNTTLMVGDSRGGLSAWFCVRPDPAGGKLALTKAHTINGPSAITALAVDPTVRVVAAGHADGNLRLHYLTSERTVVDVYTEQKRPVRAALVARMAAGLAALTDSGVDRWSVGIGHPETSAGTLFGKVWYESYSEPAHSWQTVGHGTFEMKLGLMPLIFGTLKATFYAMLFATPLALLAAIYTSEFLRPRTKARVKPAIELMASLPSVVLGYIAVVVISEAASDILPQILSGIFLLPFMLLLGAYLWQLLPRAVAVRHAVWKFGLMIVMVPCGIGLAAVIGPKLETWLFAGDFRAWLNSKDKYGNGIGGWLILLMPLSSVAVAWLTARFVTPQLRSVSRGWSHFQIAFADLLKFLCGAGCAVGLALLVGLLLTEVGFDPRGKYHVFDTFVQRNSLVLGFVMGFAVIPIIYTVAEDALSSVPDHLRSASLGAGATPWQTAMRIVIPTAMSGLFSAVMIGLGRAVGETMIVFMAAGNTPIMEINIFSGFETLSAAIATELADAQVGGTHYRVLFLAALTLFAITFVVNSVAEVVRQRFRKRAYEL